MCKHDKDTELENVFLSWGDDNCSKIYATLTLVRESLEIIKGNLQIFYSETKRGKSVINIDFFFSYN